MVTYDALLSNLCFDKKRKRCPKCSNYVNNYRDRYKYEVKKGGEDAEPEYYTDLNILTCSICGSHFCSWCLWSCP